MRRAATRLYAQLQTRHKYQWSTSLSYSTDNGRGDDKKDAPKGRSAPVSSTPITQLFSKLNLNVKNDRRPGSRPGQPGGRPSQPGGRPHPSGDRQNQSGFRPSQPSGLRQQGPPEDRPPQGDEAWSRSQRPQHREPSTSFDISPEDEPGFGGQQQSRPRQRQKGAQQGHSTPGRRSAPPRPLPRKGSASRGSAISPKGEGSAQRRRPSFAGNRQSSGPGGRGREAQILRNAPKVIQDLAMEEQRYQLNEGEHMALLDKKTNARIRSTAEMPIPQRHLDADYARASVMDMDPTVNINWGAPVRLPRYSLEDMFETESQHLKEALGIESEEEWQETKSLHFARASVQVEATRDMLGIRDAKADEAVIQNMGASVPEDHPMKNHVNMVVHQLTRNPGWSFQEKHQYMTKLLHEYVHKQL